MLQDKVWLSQGHAISTSQRFWQQCTQPWRGQAKYRLLCNSHFSPERECQFSGYNEICKCQCEEFAGAFTSDSVDFNLLRQLVFKGPVTVLAINAIKVREDVQPPESFLSERDDMVNGLKIQVQRGRLRSCRVTLLFGFFSAVNCSNEPFWSF